MKATQRLLYTSFFAVFLLFTVYGCQTTDRTVSSEPAELERTSDNTRYDAEYVEPGATQTGSADKETSATDETATTAGKETAQMKKFEKKFLGILKGHGGVLPSDASGEKEAGNRDTPEDDTLAKTAETENRPYREMEKQLYGKWINKLETESYDFRSDGTVAIVVSGQRGKTHTLHGHYMIVEADRIKIDFRGDAMASQMPPRYFKISISENVFSLTDEPGKKGGPDGPTTEYNRVE